MSPYIVLFAFLTVSFAKEHVPVVLWGDFGKPSADLKVSGLSQLRTFDFSQILHHLVTHRPHILLFSEENLSVEDFSRDERDGISFPNLRKSAFTSEEFLYLPSVEAPLSGFHQLTHHGYSFTNFDEESLPLVSSPTIFKVNLREPEAMESRASFLLSHDEAIERISKEAIRKYKKVLCAYTGKHASFVVPEYNRLKREVEEEELDEVIMKDKNNTIFIVANSPIVLSVGENITYLSKIAYVSTQVKGEATNITLDVKFNVDGTSLISVDFNFLAGINQAWLLESVEVEGFNVKMRSKIPVGAPARYSFFCASNITFKGPSTGGASSMIVLQNLQVQPHVVDQTFGPASDCIPYFSATIWSGILISTLLLFVAIMSILFILDIHTNDRFDDPKGKTITVSNAE